MILFPHTQKITEWKKLCKLCLIRVNTLKAVSQKWNRLFLILVWEAHKEEISTQTQSAVQRQWSTDWIQAMASWEILEKVLQTVNSFWKNWLLRFCIPASKALPRLSVGYFRCKHKSKWTWVSFSEAKWQFIKVRQPLRLQCWGTSEEIFPVEMVNVKARIQDSKFSLPGTHGCGYLCSRKKNMKLKQLWGQ